MSTWIVIADGWHARVLREPVPGGALEQALPEDLVNTAARGFSRERGDDRPGRAFDPGAGSPHAMEPREDPHQREERRFAEQVAKVINAAAERKSFERLVIVAPPRMLGDLRPALGSAAKARVVGEVAKELLRLPEAALAEHLRKILDETRFPA